MPPQALIFQLALGALVSKAVAAMCRLKVFDHVPKQPPGASAETIAERCGADARALYRALRAISVSGLVAEAPNGTFTLTSAGELLQVHASNSMAHFAMWMASDVHDQAFDRFEHSLRTGEPTFDFETGEMVFDYFAKRPEANNLFQTAMTAISNVSAAPVASSYDFAPFHIICDVGGGHGTLLSAILQRSPHSRGILFEQPQVIAEAPKRLAELGVTDRVTLVAGDLFVDKIPCADVFTLKHILHDWSDEACVKMLSSCRLSLNRGGRVLIVEHVLSGPGVPDPAKWLDIEMLAVCHGGRERTEEEFIVLLNSAGLSFKRLIPTPGPLKIVEAGTE
jgi:hypothetical protein